MALFPYCIILESLLAKAIVQSIPLPEIEDKKWWKSLFPPEPEARSSTISCLD
jgi:hypothetical protein